MEALVVLGIVAVGAAAFVGLGALLTRSGEQVDLNPSPRRPRRRRPHVVGGLLLAVGGGLVIVVSLGGWVTNGYEPCETDPHRSVWWPLQSRSNAVVVTSSVLEYESGTGGLFCENERLLRVQARARPSGRKPVFLGVAGAAPAHLYLGAGRYEIAASDFSLLETRRVGNAIRRLTPPSQKPFWRSSVVFPLSGADAVARLVHEWKAVGVDPFVGPRFGTPPAERFWLIAMNTDGTPGIDAALRYEVGRAPTARWGWLVGIAAGIGLVVTGIAIAVRRPQEPLV